ncbi:unnamed protein product [Didymodactylos carnosus]|uniref:Uncharacterized protein n=1 Tax=Didymodactylos carnosus TaxID=1234261 RepID=A0A813Z8A1_9BILA|nr:unnamed protein product [Didymodactylos carnosus]CAF1231685.1 unnamed protein product [Didymodactylos carnosus]CAF3679534.1 unnamed protein product [Didymodactylos carnosus]CAF4039801.1 unnamed protein product [Didymodactylos carnosus]
MHQVCFYNPIQKSETLLSENNKSCLHTFDDSLQIVIDVIFGNVEKLFLDPTQPIIPIPTHTIAAPLPVITATQTTNQSTTLLVTPAWYEPIKLPAVNKIRLPVHYNKDSPADVRTFECLSTYRSMKNKDQPIDFVAQPFTSATNNTETLIVVLNELAQQLGARLTFTEKAFQYDDSDYRTACGVGNLGSIHSMIAAGENVQTAKCKLHLKLNYEDVTSSAQTLRDFTIAFINDISAIVGCKKEFIRVFSISHASSLYIEFGITTTELEETKKLAEQLKHILNHLPTQKRQDILQYLIQEPYDYHWKAALSFLQLQEFDLDPRYNRDYPHPQEEKRGGRPYYFPQGWYRHALKVDNKYTNDQVWLGMNNSPGEWIVAYHGTKSGVVRSIVNAGLKHEFVTADACKPDAKLQRPSIPDVKGLYVATHCENGASIYTGDGFKIRDSSGTVRTYRIVFQCRVENDKFTEHNGPVRVGLALRVFDEKAIRPYGLLLKELKMDGAELVILCGKIDAIKDCELNDVNIRTFVDQAETFANENNICLSHTSALTGKNIHTVFNQMILCILSNHILLQTITERAKDATETLVIALAVINKEYPKLHKQCRKPDP